MLWYRSMNIHTWKGFQEIKRLLFNTLQVAADLRIGEEQIVFLVLEGGPYRGIVQKFADLEKNCVTEVMQIARYWSKYSKKLSQRNYLVYQFLPSGGNFVLFFPSFFAVFGINLDHFLKNYLELKSHINEQFLELQCEHFFWFGTL